MIHWFSPNRQEASARRDTRTPWPQSGPKWTRRSPVEHPYWVDATGFVRSHAHHWSMCGYIAEHAPMLKSSNTRRSGSLPGCCASPTTTVDMRQRVGVRRGGRSNSSDPSSTDMARLRDRSAASKTARKALAVMTADILRWRQDDPQAQPRGNETTPSRLGCGIHLP